MPTEPETMAPSPGEVRVVVGDVGLAVSGLVTLTVETVLLPAAS